jgi:para-nitrobenzyl esterase
VRTKETATEDAKKLLATLGLTTSQISELQTIPADKLLAASRRAMPVVDGRSVPHQTWQPGAPPEAAGVSLLIGNCKDEATLFSLDNTALFSLDWQSLKAQEIKTGIPEDKVAAIIDTYRENYPNDSASDLYFRIAADRGARTNAIAQAQSKLDQQSGDVYMYNFSWDTPVDNGRVRAFHTAELPLAMRLVAYPEAEELSKQIAGAWAGFARSGNPNHPHLPHWEKYSTTKKSTMVFDVGKTTLVDQPAHRELALLQGFSTGTL